jgi:hypothetical protein
VLFFVLLQKHGTKVPTIMVRPLPSWGRGRVYPSPTGGLGSRRRRTGRQTPTCCAPCTAARATRTRLPWSRRSPGGGTARPRRSCWPSLDRASTTPGTPGRAAAAARGHRTADHRPAWVLPRPRGHHRPRRRDWTVTVRQCACGWRGRPPRPGERAERSGDDRAIFG